MLTLPVEEICDSVAEGWVYDPVIRPGCGWAEATANLVFALRTGLEMAQPFSDAVVDSLVVAGFEMQAMKIRETAPVPSIDVQNPQK